MRGRLWLGVLVLAGVAAIAVLAVVDAVRGDGTAGPAAATAARDERQLVTGPDVPGPATLPGRLVLLTGPECRVQVLDLADLRLGAPGPATACRLWPSPRGDLVAVLQHGEGRPRLQLTSVGEPPTILTDLGPVAFAPTWGPDGDRIAICRPDGSTSVVRSDGIEIEQLPGCHPRFSPSGAVVTSPAAFREEAGGTGYVIGRSFAPDGADLLVTASPAAQFGFELALEVRREGVPERSLRVPAYGPATGFYGVRVELAPGGGEVALSTPELLSPTRPEDLLALLDLRSGVAVSGVTDRRYRGLTWSPDGVWLAFSTGDDVLVFGPARTDPVHVLPLRAEAIGWLRPQPRPGTGHRRRRRGAHPRPRRRGGDAGSRTSGAPSDPRRVEGSAGSLP